MSVAYSPNSGSLRLKDSPKCQTVKVAPLQFTTSILFIVSRFHGKSQRESFVVALE
ncbi:MAG: hypothetical protein ACO3EZ_09735 [Prochlorotrichaceae cyanobacterium]